MDPLSKLLKAWQPRSPYPTHLLVRDTMQQLHQNCMQPSWKQRFGRWCEILDDWLPSPGILLPVAASLIFLLSAIHWIEAEQQAKTMAALRWHQELTQPLAKVSLTGAYVQLAKEQIYD